MLSRFVQGFVLPIRGAALLWRTPALRRLALVPLLLNSVLYLLTLTLFFQFYDTGFSLFIDRPEAWYWLIGYYVLWGLAFLIVVALFVFSFVFVGKALATPFLDILSERTELALQGSSTTEAFQLGRWLIDILRSLGHSILILLVLIIAFPLSFIPAVGAAVWIGLGWLLLVYEFTSFALDRRRLTFRQKCVRILSNRAESLGFGAALFVLLTIPVVNIVSLSVAAVSGTLLVYQWENVSPAQPS